MLRPVRLGSRVVKGSLAFVFGVASWAASITSAATLPVNATFTGGSADGLTFAAATNGSWTLPPDVAKLTLTAQAEGAANTGSIQVTDDLSAVDFVASVKLTVNELTVTGGQPLVVDTGLALFGTSSALAGAYLFDFNANTGAIRIVGADGGIQTSSGTFTYAAGETYTLTVEGTHPSPGVLDLKFTLKDPNAPDVVVTASDTSPSAGQFFGIRFRPGAVAGTQTFSGNVDFDDFSFAAVPEPNSAVIAIFGLVGMSLLGLRARR